MASQLEAFVTIWIDGEPYEEVTDRVLSFEVEEHTCDVSTFQISLDMTPGGGDWDLLADGRFALLHQVTFDIGLGESGSLAPTEKTRLFQGYVTAVEPRIGEGRVPGSELRLSGLDAFGLMHLEERTRTWEDVSDADIARTIFESYGMTADVDATGPVRSSSRGPLVQRGTDAELVRWLARRVGFECFAEPRSAGAAPSLGLGKDVVAHFHAPRVNAEVQPVLTLFPDESPNVLSFSARWESHQPAVVLAAHIDEKTRRIRSARKTEPRRARLGPTSRADILAKRLPVVLPVHPDPGRAVEASVRAFQDVPFDATEVENLAAAELERADWLATARAEVEGLRYPKVLRARRPVALKGAGKLLDGNWYVRGARHTWERDAELKRYRVHAELARDALNGVG